MGRKAPEHKSEPRTARGKAAAKKRQELEEAIGIREKAKVESEPAEEIVEKEKEIYRAQALETGKPENIVDKIAEGKLQKFFNDNCLLKQPYVRDPNITVEDMLNEVIAKIGENISIKQFTRYQIGET